MYVAATGAWFLLVLPGGDIVSLLQCLFLRDSEGLWVSVGSDGI